MGAVGLGGRSHLERYTGHRYTHSFLTVAWETVMWPLGTTEMTEALLILCLSPSQGGPWGVKDHLHFSATTQQSQNDLESSSKHKALHAVAAFA